jgi:hypothetical protein
VFFQRGWFATDYDFIGSLAYQLGDGPEINLSTEEVFQRYSDLEALSEAEADIARAGVLADYRFLRAAAAREPAFPDFANAVKAHRVVGRAYESAADNGNPRIVP